MTERQYPWDVLEIDETDDKKAIKKAYAALIKQYKPDKNPGKFQEIQAAYKYALSYSKPEIADTNKNVLEYLSKDNLSELKINTPEIFSNKKEQDVVNKTISELKKLLKLDQNKIDLIKNWHFVTYYNNILDIQLKRDLSYQFFEEVAQFNLKYLEDKKRPVVHLSIIEYLDKTFEWSSSWQDLQNRFPYEYIEVTLQRAEKKISLDKFVTPLISRALGFYLDYIFAILILYGIKWMSYKFFMIKFQETNLSYLLISILFFHRILMESFFPTRRSIGKIARGLFIIDLNGFYINFKKSLQRHYLIAVNLTPYIISLFKVKFDELVYVAMVITIISVNLIAYFSKGCLLHDIINRTRVFSSN